MVRADSIPLTKARNPSAISRTLKEKRQTQIPIRKQTLNEHYGFLDINEDINIV